jgi:Transglycosylase-like domain
MKRVFLVWLVSIGLILMAPATAGAMILGPKGERTMITPPPPPPPPPLVSDATMASWYRVAVCESGNDWNNPNKPWGGLGLISWAAFGGTQFAPMPWQATPQQQVYIAEQIQSTPPDQNGCSSW